MIQETRLQVCTDYLVVPSNAVSDRAVNSSTDESGVSSDEQKGDEDDDRGAKRPRHERESFDSQHVDQIAGEVETGMRL